MAYEQKDMSGTLFKNDKREKDSHPHAKGSALIDGVEYWVSAWTKEGQKGKFQSLSFQRKEQRQAATQQSSRPAQNGLAYRKYVPNRTAIGIPLTAKGEGDWISLPFLSILKESPATLSREKVME